MDIPIKSFTIAKSKSNRYFSLACEIERALQLDKGQVFGLMKRKGLPVVDEEFRKVLKETRKNKTSLFLYHLSKLPNKKVPRSKQLTLIK